MAAIANVASACHFKTYRIGLVESGGSILETSVTAAALARSKLADFNCFCGLPATQRPLSAVTAIDRNQNRRGEATSR